MLEKNEKKLIFDAHFHYFECKKLGIFDFPEEFAKKWSGISCAHSKEEWIVQQTAPESVIQAYGMHPQNAEFENINESAFFLETLLKDKKIFAVGEAGFDYFSEKYASQKTRQEEIWNIQLDLALHYQIPVIVHCRKANEKLFEYSKQLSKLPEVLFHSFIGTPLEGFSLLKRGINAYFSFGKQIFNNNKKVIQCLKELPFERVHAETDAPFQNLKNEKYTHPIEILNIIQEMQKLKNNYLFL